MNPTVMHGLALGLLVSFGMVVGIAMVFATLYRRHLRLLRRSQRWVDPLGPLVGGGRSVPLPMPVRWMAVKTTNTPYLKEFLQLGDTVSAPWSEAMSRARERRLFVSPPWQGWTLVIGAALPDPDADIDRLYRFLSHLSREMGEVQFFGADRVLNHHAWAWLRDGRVLRAYAWAGGALWNQGERTLDERLLGLACREYGEMVDDEAPRGGAAEQQNTDRVALLARRWSLDPGEASAHFLDLESSSRFRRKDDAGEG